MVCPASWALNPDSPRPVGAGGSGPVCWGNLTGSGSGGCAECFPADALSICLYTDFSVHKDSVLLQSVF